MAGLPQNCRRYIYYWSIDWNFTNWLAAK